MSEKSYVEIDGEICLVEGLSQEDIPNHLNELLMENNQLKEEKKKLKKSLLLKRKLENLDLNELLAAAATTKGGENGNRFRQQILHTDTQQIKNTSILP